MGREIHIFTMVHPVTEDLTYFFRPYCNTQDTYISDNDFDRLGYKGEIYEHWSNRAPSREKAIIDFHCITDNEELRKLRLERATGIADSRYYDPYDENGLEVGPQGSGAADDSELQFDAFLTINAAAHYMVAFNHGPRAVKDYTKAMKACYKEWCELIKESFDAVKTSYWVESKTDFKIGKCRFMTTYPKFKANYTKDSYSGFYEEHKHEC